MRERGFNRYIVLFKYLFTFVFVFSRIGSSHMETVCEVQICTTGKRIVTKYGCVLPLSSVTKFNFLFKSLTAEAPNTKTGIPWFLSGYRPCRPAREVVPTCRAVLILKRGFTVWWTGAQLWCGEGRWLQRPFSPLTVNTWGLLLSRSLGLLTWGQITARVPSS